MQPRPAGGAAHSRAAKHEQQLPILHRRGGAAGSASPGRALLALALFVATLVAGVALPVRHRARARAARHILLIDSLGATALNCTLTRGPVGRTCLVGRLQHDAADTNATRDQTGRASALAGAFQHAEVRVPEPLAVTFYDDPIRLLARPQLDAQRCPDISTSLPSGGPTVFMSRDNPSLYHLIRIQLLPMFLALASFGLQHGRFQLVFIDGKPRNWATYVFDEVSGYPAQLLPELPDCFSAADAIFGVRYDNFRISAHAAATARDTAASRPQLTAFAAWLLGRFNVTANPVVLLLVQQPPDAAAADVQAAFENSRMVHACSWLHTVEPTSERPLLTLVVRTDKSNGQGRRLTGTEHLLAAAEACGFATQMVDMAALPFAEQLQLVANSSVLVTVHGAATTLLLALPVEGVSLELRPYKFDASALFFHLYSNWAAAAARKALVWHNTNAWHSSPGRARVDDYKNHDTRVVREAADGMIAAAAAALAVAPERWDYDRPVDLNQPVLRSNFSHVPGDLG